MTDQDEVVVRATNLRKVYRLYAKPSYRFRDMFGMLGDRPGAFTEHAALDGVTFEIRRGEKVAIIGRNGAGKSTFLKLVTNVIQPTSGAIDVRGRIHALLQIGTGFHPDFTGRENVYAYFAQLGISGRDADRRYADVVDFAELEEYIDQPVKTYSTGMAVRLMFSASTAISPELLVLDEVLGVGDAYFSQKSFDRMRELCDRQGSTLLLVTHDIYSAIQLCSRVIWFDRGRVLMDGSGSTVVKAYEDSIRQQEETRLRLKKQERLERQRAAATDAVHTHLLVDVRARQRAPQPVPVYFSGIELRDGDVPIASLPLGADAFDENQPSHLVREGTSWGEATTWQGRTARPLLNFGSPFHKVAGVFRIPGALERAVGRDLSLQLTYWSDVPCDLTLHAFADRREWSLGALAQSTGGWMTHQARLADAVTPDAAGPAMQGTGRILVEQVAVLDDRGIETHFLEHGKAATIALRYRVADRRVAERAQVLVQFHRDGLQTACRLLTRDLMFDGRLGATGTVTMTMPKVLLGAGEYAVTIKIVEQDYYDHAQTLFYSINPGVYCCLNRVLDITVTGGGIIAAGTVFVGEGQWTLIADPNDTAGVPAGEGAPSDRAAAPVARSSGESDRRG